MDTWDSRFPFTADETNLFAQLHAKATKFPAPVHIKPRGNEDIESSVTDNVINEQQEPVFENESLTHKLQVLHSDFQASQSLIRHLDLLLEAHKQLNLATQLTETEAIDEQDSYVVDTDDATNALNRVRERIKYLEDIQQAQKFLSTCSIPSVASSPLFISSLLLLLNHTNISPDPVIPRCGWLMQKCWDNGLVAMDRVLDRDLDSIESYLDDRVYKDLKNHVLKPLLLPTRFEPFKTDLLTHFLASYTQLRENFVKFTLDARLNNQFSACPPNEQVLHLIERTRLIMKVEKGEFTDIFASDTCVNTHTQNNTLYTAHLNRILETVGNLMLNRLDSPCRSLSETEKSNLSAFTTPLYTSLLSESDSKDPFGLFLKLLTDKYCVNSAAVNSDVVCPERRTSTNNVFNV